MSICCYSIMYMTIHSNSLRVDSWKHTDSHAHIYITIECYVGDIMMPYRETSRNNRCILESFAMRIVPGSWCHWSPARKSFKNVHMCVSTSSNLKKLSRRAFKTEDIRWTWRQSDLDCHTNNTAKSERELRKACCVCACGRVRECLCVLALFESCDF